MPFAQRLQLAVLLFDELEKVPAAQSSQVRFTLLLPATRTRLPEPHLSQAEQVVLPVLPMVPPVAYVSPGQEEQEL